MDAMDFFSGRILAIGRALVLIFVFFTSMAAYPVRAEPLSPQDFEFQYADVQKQYHHLLSQQKKAKFSAHGQRTSHFQKQTSRSNSSALKALKQKKTLFDSIHGLKESFNQAYLKKNPDVTDPIALNLESTRLAILLVDEIQRLKRVYKSFAIPIMHNMLIDIGIKKRGACKDWAEDLLAFLRPIKRKHFYVTWGEANPKKMTEHNVAVVYPNTATFYDGVVVDPWRTSGKPFWVPVKKDKHYKWNPWDYYGVY